MSNAERSCAQRAVLRLVEPLSYGASIQAIPLNPSYNVSLPDVILLRSPDDPDLYVTTFAEAGYETICEPVLRFTFPHQEALRERLRSTRYEALVATSPRAGQALRRAFREEPALRDRWRGRPAYAIGPKTESFLCELGLNARGDDTGTASALAERIADDAPEALLLFLSGSRRRDDLPDGLQAAGVPFDEQVVYDTHLRSTLDLPPAGNGTWLVFFSPSGLEAAAAAAVDVETYRLAAIGPTTAEALRAAGHAVAAVADSPNPESLTTAIQDAEAPS